MSSVAYAIDHRYTYGDYVQWDGPERWELIDGVPYLMSPAPSRTHQRVLREVFLQIGNALRGRKCEVYVAPFDVRLPDFGQADKDIRTVVQPDLVIVCDPAKVDDKGARGAPVFVLEVLSPSSATRDLTTKAALYEEHGVREYWIVDPEAKTVTALVLGDDEKWRAPRVFGAQETAQLTSVPGLAVDLELVFSDR